MIENGEKQNSTPPEADNILGICRLAGNGDPYGQRRLMEILFNRIHKTASYLTVNQQEAMDIAQTACIQVLRSAGAYRGDATITYWADRVTLQTAASIFRKKTRRKKIREDFFQPAPATIDVDENVERAHVRDKLTRMLHSLKQKHREIVLLRYIHGYTIKEAAALCDIPIETARTRLKQGRKGLKKKVLADPVLKEWVREWII